MSDLSDIAAALAAEVPRSVQLPKGRIGPAVGMWDSLPLDIRHALEALADEIAFTMDEAPRKAVSLIRSRCLSQDELVGLWTLLDSAHRTALRKAGL